MFHKFWHFLTPQKILFTIYSAVLVTRVSMELWPPHSPDLNEPMQFLFTWHITGKKQCHFTSKTLTYTELELCNAVFFLLPWRWTLHVPLKYWHQITMLHSLKTQVIIWTTWYTFYSRSCYLLSFQYCWKIKAFTHNTQLTFVKDTTVQVASCSVRDFRLTPKCSSGIHCSGMLCITG